MNVSKVKMKSLIPDFNIIFWSLIISVLTFCFYFRALKKFYFPLSKEGFVLIEFVRALKKTCPVQANNKWRLLSLKWNRCFSKTVLLPGFKNCLKLYGTTCAVACSSMYAFSVISDVSKWGEWEPSCMVVRQLNNNHLAMDHFMQAKQIVCMQRSINIQSGAAFYQFLSFPSKCVKWILLWNAKRFEFMFFLLQPAVNRNSDSHCVITHLYSSSQSSSLTSTLVSQRLRNLKEFLTLSQLENGSISPLPMFQENKSNVVFMLTPLLLYRRLRGFNLIVKRIKEAPKCNALRDTLSRQVCDHFRRTVSETNISDRKNIKRTLSVQYPLNSSIPDDDMEIIENISEPKSLPSKCNLNEEEEDDTNQNLPSIQETEEADGKSEMFFCSSTSDFEILDSNQHFLDTRKADYLTQGNYGASVLQTEMLLASQYDGSQLIGNRVSGGWIHSSSYKGIPVLSKSINLKVMKIFSFLCQTDISVNFKDVWKCVKNPQFRFISDETVKTVQIIDRISDSQRLIHVYHEMNGLLRKEATDFCLLQTEREEKSCFYSVFQSIEYEKCPFMSAVTRGSLKPSGWIVQELAPNNCRVTYLVQILLNCPGSIFIQELNTLVPQSLFNLRQYITTRPK